jgi:hypothetical protein
MAMWAVSARRNEGATNQAVRSPRVSNIFSTGRRGSWVPIAG